MMDQQLPPSQAGILDRLCSDKVVVNRGAGLYDITNLGALLFARRLGDFEHLGRKRVRVIDYSGTDRIAGGSELVADAGYAPGFENLVAYIESRLPNNEHIAHALRVETGVYPTIAIRELVANAIVHQDLDVRGDSPLVEIITDRMEITNPGLPLIDTLRFINEPPQSRNEALAGFMRRLGICEERGSGIDKVIAAVEAWQLPAPDFTTTQNHTRVYLYSHRPFARMTGKDRIRACYQHVCLMFECNEPATNASRRKRFAFDDDDARTVTKIIAATLERS